MFKRDVKEEARRFSVLLDAWLVKNQKLQGDFVVKCYAISKKMTKQLVSQHKLGQRPISMSSLMVYCAALECQAQDISPTTAKKIAALYSSTKLQDRDGVHAHVLPNTYAWTDTANSDFIIDLQRCLDRIENPVDRSKIEHEIRDFTQKLVANHLMSAIQRARL